MLPAYVDPIAPGLVPAWAGALRVELAALAVATLCGLVAVVGLVAAEGRRAPVDRAVARSSPTREVSMRYMFLLYTNRAEWEAAGEPEPAVIRAHLELAHDLRAAGKYRTSDALEPTATATTVRVRSGRTLVTDGPFAETREQLGGYYLVEARDLDDAIAIAARIPDAGVGSVEIRPVRELEVRP